MASVRPKCCIFFISNRLDDHRPNCTGKPVAGYEARIVDDAMHDVPHGTVGKLAVRGPTGCRYLADKRQQTYVKDGWNITGDAFYQDEEGYFHCAVCNDDMIISAGYNIAGPEVESALLAHPAVKECAVIGAPSQERGQIVEEFVVLNDGFQQDEECLQMLQGFVKQPIAPYKYPRSIRFIEALPKTTTGKIQRFRLNQEYYPSAGSPCTNSSKKTIK